MTVSFIPSSTLQTAQANGVASYTFRGGAVTPVTQTLTDGATIIWDTLQGQNANVTLGGNRVMAAPTNLSANTFYVIEVRQDATGGRSLAWNSAFKWGSGTVPTLSSTALARDYFCFESDGTNMYEVGRNLGVI